MHNGHKLLLSVAALLLSDGGRMVIGVTGDQLLAKKALKELLESGPVRCLRVLSFLRAVRPKLIYDAVKITDPYGPAIVDPELEAIVVSRETASGGAGAREFDTTCPPTATFAITPTTPTTAYRVYYSSPYPSMQQEAARERAERDACLHHGPDGEVNG